MNPDFHITAILAWGSLTWEPKDLNFIKDVGWKTMVQFYLLSLHVYQIMED